MIVPSPGLHLWQLLIVVHGICDQPTSRATTDGSALHGDQHISRATTDSSPLHCDQPTSRATTDGSPLHCDAYI